MASAASSTQRYSASYTGIMAASIAWSSLKFSKPSETASSPALCGARVQRRCRHRERCRPCAFQRRAGEFERAQEVIERAQRPRVLNRRAGYVIGDGIVGLRKCEHLVRRYIENSARGSMKRRMSQGQATRSIFGRARVTQRLMDSPVTPRSGALRAAHRIPSIAADRLRESTHRDQCAQFVGARDADVQAFTQ